jgi:flagellin-like hook-associated protein FlgL
MRRFLGSILTILTAFGAYAQTQPAGSSKSVANCTQQLRLARAVYEQGRLHELEALLDGCLKGQVGTQNGFATVQEKVDAYKLLVLSYIYLEEPEKANNAMLGLLDTDHFFEVNKTSDPAEFQALYKTFRTEPILSWGGKINVNLNLPSISKVYSVGAESAGNGKYKPGAHFAIGAFVEREFFPNLPEKNFLKYTVLRAEAFWIFRAFSMSNNEVQANGSRTDKTFSAGRFEGKSISQWIDLNAILRYRYNHNSNWDPYVGIGPGISYLLKHEINQVKYERQKLVYTGDKVSTVGSDAYSGPAVDVKSAYKKIAQSVTAVWGVNTRLGEFYINLEGRVQFGLNNLINTKTRSIQALDLDYGMTLNDYRQTNILLSAGVTVPQFKPRKKTKK